MQKKKQIFSLNDLCSSYESSSKLKLAISVKHLIASILLFAGTIKLLITSSTKLVSKIYPRGIQDRKAYNVFRHYLIREGLILLTFWTD